MAQKERKKAIASIEFTNEITTDEIDSICSIFEQNWNYEVEPVLDKGKLVLFRADTV